MSDSSTESYLQLDQQLCFSLYSASNAVVRSYQPLLKELDLTYPQYLAMMVLWNQNGLRVSELGSHLHLDSGTLTPLLKRLETKGLVERRSSELDERVKEIFLTRKGKGMRKGAECVPMAIYEKMGLDFEKLVQLKDLCDELFTHIQSTAD